MRFRADHLAEANGGVMPVKHPGDCGGELLHVVVALVSGYLYA